MMLPALQVWYRILCKKITHGVAIHQINITDSPNCRLCNASTEDLTHCPFKNDIWSNILSSRYLQNPYHSNKLLSFICTLTLPTYIASLQQQINGHTGFHHSPRYLPDLQDGKAEFASAMTCYIIYQCSLMHLHHICSVALIASIKTEILICLSPFKKNILPHFWTTQNDTKRLHINFVQQHHEDSVISNTDVV